MSSPRKIWVTYIGHRSGQKGTIFKVFLKGKKEIYFTNISVASIGFPHEAYDYGKGDIRIKKRPEWRSPAEGSIPKETLQKWEAENIAALGRRKAEVTRAKLRRLPPLVLTELQALKKIAKGMSYIEQRCLADFIVEKLTE